MRNRTTVSLCFGRDGARREKPSHACLPTADQSGQAKVFIDIPDQSALEVFGQYVPPRMRLSLERRALGSRADVVAQSEQHDAGSTARAHLTLIAWCKDCRHQVEPDPAEMAERYGSDTTVPDWERLVCSRCGSRNVSFVVSGTQRDPLSD